jgi:hypothetical protein
MFFYGYVVLHMLDVHVHIQRAKHAYLDISKLFIC